MLPSNAARQRERAARRSVVLAVIVAVHVGLLLLLTSGRIGVTRPPAVAAVVSFIDDQEAESPHLPPPVRLVEPNLRLPEVPPVLLNVAPVDASQAITVAAQPPPVAETTAPPADAGPRRVSFVEYLRAPQPHYPREARRQRAQGVVLLRVLVGEDGAPLEITIERSSGDRSLDDAAREAVTHARFKPYRENGFARRAVVTVPIEFSLRNVLASN